MDGVKAKVDVRCGDCGAKIGTASSEGKQDLFRTARFARPLRRGLTGHPRVGDLGLSYPIDLPDFFGVMVPCPAMSCSSRWPLEEIARRVRWGRREGMMTVKMPSSGPTTPSG